MFRCSMDEIKDQNPESPSQNQQADGSNQESVGAHDQPIGAQKDSSEPLTGNEIIQANRGTFFKDGLMTQFLGIILVGFTTFLIFLTAGRAYVARDNQIYFSTNENGSVFSQIPLDSALGQTRSDISYWASQTMASTFTYNFVDFFTSLESKSDHFTARGWEAFKRVLVDKDLVRPVIEQRVVMSGIPSGVPRFGYTGVNNGKYTWQLQVPLKLQFSGTSALMQVYQLDVELKVVRTNVSASTPEGIIIDDIQVLSFK